MSDFPSKPEKNPKSKAPKGSSEPEDKGSVARSEGSSEGSDSAKRKSRGGDQRASRGGDRPARDGDRAPRSGDDPPRRSSKPFSPKGQGGKGGAPPRRGAPFKGGQGRGPKGAYGGPRRDDRGPRRDDRGPRRFDDRGPRRDDRGPRRFDDRGPRRDDRGPRRFDDRGPRRDDRGPRRFDDRGPRRDDRAPQERQAKPQERREFTLRERAERASRALSEFSEALAKAWGRAHEGRLPVEEIEVTLRLPLTRPEDREALTEEWVKTLNTKLDEALAAADAFELGRVRCFLCNSTRCDHATPPTDVSTFAGYSPNGKPEWMSFTNLLISRKDPRVDRMYNDPPEIIALAIGSTELAEGLMPSFGAHDGMYRVLGQVAIGRVPANLSGRGKIRERVVFTLQIVETTVPGQAVTLRSNLLGLSMDAITEAAALGDPRGQAEALRLTVRSINEKIEGLAFKALRSEVDLVALAQPLLNEIRGDLERVFRPARRRTQHAQERHEQGERPTSHAMDDVRQASDDAFYRDTRHDTVVVIGDRLRAHVFNEEGKLVTSLRMRSDELEKKVRKGRWKPIKAKEVKEIRARVQPSED